MNTKMLLILSSIIMTSTSAFAQDSTALQQTVRYGDLNLATASGQARLQDRLDAAVRAVCPADAFGQGLAGHARLRACISTARVGMDAKMNLAIAQAAPRPEKIAEASLAH